MVAKEVTVFLWPYHQQVSMVAVCVVAKDKWSEWPEWAAGLERGLTSSVVERWEKPTGAKP